MKRYRAILPGRACIQVVQARRNVQVFNGDEFVADTDADPTILKRMRLLEEGSTRARFEEVGAAPSAAPAIEKVADASLDKPRLNSKNETLAKWLIDVAGLDSEVVADMDRDGLKAAVKAAEVSG